MSYRSEWPAIWRINLRFAAATIAGGIAWLACELITPEWWGLGVIVLFTGLGATASALGGIADIIRLFWRRRQLDRFERLGGGPRGDRGPDDDDLRKGGMTR